MTHGGCGVLSAREAYGKRSEGHCAPSSGSAFSAIGCRRGGRGLMRGAGS